MVKLLDRNSCFVGGGGAINLVVAIHHHARWALIVIISQSNSGSRILTTNSFPFGSVLPIGGSCCCYLQMILGPIELQNCHLSPKC